MPVPAVLPYWPTEFVMREPPPRAVLAPVRNLGLLAIDGYADLDPGGRAGLGAHADAALGIPAIGVAKTLFRTASHPAQVRWGNSARPLFVTAAGMSAAQPPSWSTGWPTRSGCPTRCTRADDWDQNPPDNPAAHARHHPRQKWDAPARIPSAV